MNHHNTVEVHTNVGSSITQDVFDSGFSGQLDGTGPSLRLDPLALEEIWQSLMFEIIMISD
jgi:hypothetical protein